MDVKIRPTVMFSIGKKGHAVDNLVNWLIIRLENVPRKTDTEKTALEVTVCQQKSASQFSSSVLLYMLVMRKWTQ